VSWEILISETAVETFEAIRAQILQRLGNKAVEDFEKNTSHFSIISQEHEKSR